jgi:hypothetical protein
MKANKLDKLEPPSVKCFPLALANNVSPEGKLALTVITQPFSINQESVF